MESDTRQLIGISEVGHVENGVDVPWGITQEEGVTITEGITTEDLFDGQGAGMRDSNVTRATGQIVFRMQTGDLRIRARLKGLPETAVTGNLSPVAPATPTAEKMVVLSNQIGTREFHLYVIAPGPGGPARVDVRRAKIASTGNTEKAKTAWMKPESTFNILTDSTGQLYEETHGL